VPPSFLGISTEYWALPLFGTQPTLFERALSLLRAPAGGALVVRVGGDSADHAFWALKPRKAPGWMIQLSPPWLHQMGGLVERLGVRLIVDLNLVTDTPLSAARWARAAAESLPRGSILGFEVGNEPDLYARRYWSWVIAHPAVGPSVLPKDLSPTSYSRDYQAYANALARVAPRVPLLGPAVANPAADINWVSTLMSSPHPRLGVVSGHVYPYSACAAPRAATHPTIARVLSENATAGIAQRLHPAVAIAHRSGLPFRLTEINSVTCGGLAGVSDTFATALWAPDALMELLHTGVDGVNVHIRARTINAAFSLNRQGMAAHPLLYGMMLFNRTLGPGARLAPVRVSARAQPHRASRLKIWAVRVNGGGLHVLIIDKGNRPARVELRVPAIGAASVQRLLAPSVSSRTGVTLAGQHVGADGLWHGAKPNEAVWPTAHGYVITVPRMSAALVGMRLSAGAASAPQTKAGRHVAAPHSGRALPGQGKSTRRSGGNGSRRKSTARQ
jgi:hypothetical protein